MFVVDPDAGRLRAVRELLVNRGRDRTVLFFHGRLSDFRRDLQAIAGLVILGGEGGALSFDDAVELGRLVDPGTPGLALSAAGAETVQVLGQTGLFSARHADEGGPFWRIHATEACSALGMPLCGSAFDEVKRRLDERYFLLGELSDGCYTPVAAQTRPAREALLDSLRRQPHGWPCRTGIPSVPLETLPGRRPWPRISIITPSFNQGAYIEEAILSVLNQGYPNVEHIIVDGGSEDGTAAVLEKYRGRLAHVISEPDRGQSHAINKGMALATGQILTWLNSDDLLAPGALHAAALAFLTSGADMVAGMCGIYEDGRITGYHLTSADDGPLVLDDLLDLEGSWNAGRFFYQPEVMFTRELWERAGAHVKESLRYSMDYELWLRFAKAGARLHVIGRPLAWFRLHPEQKTAKPEAFQAELREVRRAFATAGFSRRSAGSGEPRHGLRIVMVNDLGYAYGAGIAHRRIAEALRAAGHEVHAVMLRDDSEGLPGASLGLGLAMKRIADCKPDLIIAGNLHHARATALLYSELARLAPVHAVLHDFWPLTGRCAYPMDCTKYLTGCDETCPTPDEYPSLPPNEIAGAWDEKRRVMKAEARPFLLAASSWAESVAAGALRAFGQPAAETDIGRIRLGVPVDVFRPLDKIACRAALGLPKDKFIVLASGDRLEDERKRLRDVVEAVGVLDLPDLLLVLVGPSSLPDGCQSERVLTLGYFQDPSRLAMVYAAADLFVSASRAETFGQVFLEAAACGTPAVGLDVSGIREAVHPGVSGSLVAEQTPEALATEILRYYQDPDRCRAMGAWARLWVENEYSIHRCYLGFHRLWRRLGLAERWNLLPKIDFRPDVPPPPPPINPFRGMMPGVESHDLGDIEGPLPELGLGSFRWAFGPVTGIRWRAASAGGFTLFLKYRNPHRRQRLRLSVNGREYWHGELVCTGYNKSRLLLADVVLHQGLNEICLEFSQWSHSATDPRPLAVIVEEFVILPTSQASG